MTAPTPRDIAETLRDAARVLQERGWCQWRLEDSAGRLCAVGAITEAMRGKNYNLFTLTIANFARSIGEWTIPPWNDAPGRTQAEVEKALLQAADRIEVES